MWKVAKSSFIILVAVAAVAGGTYSFFSDTETSVGNTFTAGALDLKVDSEAHYNGLVCTPGENGNTWQLP
ncbi:MAG: TasA family protein, partial [Candidatus Moraniibacteriota bacterium]